MRKKTLIYIPNGLNSPEFEILLSATQKSIDNKDDVNVLICKGGKNYFCSKNIYSIKYLCNSCNQKKLIGLNKLKGKFKLSYLPDIKKIEKKLKLNFTKTFNYKYKNVDNGLSAYSSYVDLTRDRDLDGFIMNYSMNGLINTSNLLTDFFKKYLKKNYIQEVVCFNGRNNNYRPLIRVAKSFGIKVHNLEFNGDRNQTFDFEDNMPFDQKYIAKRINYFWKRKKNKKIYLIDKFCKKWSTQTLKHKDVFKVNQDPNLLPRKWDSRKKNIVFFCNSEDESLTGGKDYFFQVFKNQTEAIEYLYKLTKKDYKKLALWIRMHPRMTGLEWPFLKNLLALKNKYQDLNLILPRSRISSYKMIHNADVILTPISTLSVESVYYKKPVINFQKNPFTILNGAYIPKTRQQLRNLIFKKKLSPKSILASKKFLLFYLDGGSLSKDLNGNINTGFFYKGFKIKFNLYGKFNYFIGKILEKFYTNFVNYYLYKLKSKFFR